METINQPELPLGGSGHEENLCRVRSRLAPSIVSFCRRHPVFRAEELRSAITKETGCAAPASADRILRDLRQRGVVQYRVLDRRNSLYEVTYVSPPLF